MPLSDHIPVLDDRRFADLVEEARARIPQYTPEWTDTNGGDAGFALVELFAWMSEMLLFRIGRIPELNYLKFLELIGVELAPARPATTILVFPVKPSFAQETVIVPSRFPVASSQPDDDGPILFETDRVLTAIKNQLTAIQSFDGYAYSDLTAANADLDGGFEPFGALANTGSAFMLGFSSTSELPSNAELSLAFWPASERVIPPAPCGGGTVAVSPPGRFAWEFWAGTEWRPLKVLSDETLGFSRSGMVHLKCPPAGQIVAATLGKKTDAKRYWLRARLVYSGYERAPRLRAVRSNAVPAIQAQSVAREVVGGSEGTPSQVFQLGNTSILDGTLELDVDETGTPERWTEVSDFFGSDEDSKHFVLNRTTGEIRFGEGNRGRVPVANLAVPQANIIANFYRHGGGQRGNVAAGGVSTLMRTLPGIDAGAVSNPVAAEGGTDEETLDAAIERAPVVLKSRERAVAAEDFEMLAKQAGPVRRAHTMPLHHPDFEGINVPGVVTVLIVPDTPGPAPLPSEALMQTVCAHLDSRRLLTTELFIIGPAYIGISLDLEVIAATDANAAELTLAVENAVSAYLHPLTGGADGLGWPFGGTLFYGEIYRRALLPDVSRLAGLKIEVEGVAQPDCADVTMPKGTLVRLDELRVSVRSEEELERTA
ncbi:putative baseplate assembly protein [Erythrobacter ani]|uniref:Baseplate assembly protein n=1 Tax=Erythrobacter ani TaxID=2827235 RepID=A0ABS6SMG8_9SPHN|nr:putative baseplate assembly protein [Erythrobacter ani]MBV7266240.1 putative baseplate assembly protein [Erythrobacter ani]